MPKVSLSTIKNWFRTGLKPTQSQFWDTWDSFWHKDESIPTSSVSGLDGILAGLPTPEQTAALAQLGGILVSVSTSATLSIGAGKIVELILAESTSDGTMKAGTTASGEQIISDTITANTPALYRVDYYFKTAGTLHLTGNFTAKIYIR